MIIPLEAGSIRRLANANKRIPSLARRLPNVRQLLVHAVQDDKREHHKDDERDAHERLY